MFRQIHIFLIDVVLSNVIYNMCLFHMQSAFNQSIRTNLVNSSHMPLVHYTHLVLLELLKDLCSF
jgi:hypothetical protein